MLKKGEKNMVKFCSSCGTQINENAVFCSNCGNQMTNKQEQNLQINQNMYQQNINKSKINTMALVGFIMGCVSIFLSFWGIVGIVALVFSIIGLNQINGTNENGKGLAITGIIFGIIGVLWGVFSILLFSW